MEVYRVKVVRCGDLYEVAFEEVWDTYEAAEAAGQSWIDSSEGGGYLGMEIDEWEVYSSCGSS